MHQEGEKYIRDNVVVTRQNVAVAKAYILSCLPNASAKPSEIVDGFLQKMHVVMPNGDSAASALHRSGIGYEVLANHKW